MYGHIHIYPLRSSGMWYGGYAYLEQKVYPSSALCTIKEHAKESPLD